jgi:hypothetical protein
MMGALIGAIEYAIFLTFLYDADTWLGTTFWDAMLLGMRARD